MAIAVVGMLDEREEGLRFLKDRIERRGHNTILIDISIGTGVIESTLRPDVKGDDLVRGSGVDIMALKKMLALERDKVASIMAEGLTKKVEELYRDGKLQGIIVVGGATSTFISLAALKALPYAVPKVLISFAAAMPNYAKRLSEYFGVRDITVMHSVIDTVGMNPLVMKLLMNGAGAISGMVEESATQKKREKPSVALTEFNFCEQGAHYVRDLLEKDYHVISFPATGLGEKAAEDLVGQGLFEAFIDMVPAGFGEFLLGGNRDAGPDRLNAGINRCIPYILTPCGFEMISCGPLKRKAENDPLWVSRKLAERKLFIQDGLRVQARTTPDEMQLIARAVAEKLNKGKNKKLIKFIIPVKGFSSVSMEGGALYDPASDRAFIEELKNHVDPEIEIMEVGSHINTQEFANAVVDVLNHIRVVLI